jgi:hypothetical protein
MGLVQSCEICRLPVLEIEGQFNVLLPYYGRSDDPAFDLVGHVHSTCLSASPHRERWVEWTTTGLLRRGWRSVATVDGWNVLYSENHDDVSALHDSGSEIDFKRGELNKAKRCDGGAVVPRKEDWYYELEDEDIVESWKREIDRAGSVPLAKVIEDLGARIA